MALPRGRTPVCVTKTQYTFSTNGDLKSEPTDRTINVRVVGLF